MHAQRSRFATLRPTTGKLEVEAQQGRDAEDDRGKRWYFASPAVKSQEGDLSGKVKKVNTEETNLRLNRRRNEKTAILDSQLLK